jgi:hypothetical protein
VPQDAKVREWGVGRTRVETLRMLGRKPRVVPAHSLHDGIQASRVTIPLARFDASRCARGIDALKSYQAEWDENLRTFKRTPLHDWASHGADAFRYLSMSWREVMPSDVEPDSLAQLMQEAKRPRTFNDIWRQHIEERIENGEEFDDDGAYDFNLNRNCNTVEFE